MKTIDKIIKAQFGRLDANTTIQTLNIYREAVRPEKKRIGLFVSMILTADLLYLVIMPLLISFILQSLILNPSDLTTPLLLVGGLAAASIVTILMNHPAHLLMFDHSEKTTTKLSELAMRKLLAHSQTFFSDQKVGALAGEVFGFARSYGTLFDTFFFQLSGVIVSFVASLIIIGILSPPLLIPLGILTGLVIYQSARSIAARQIYRKEYKQRNAQFIGLIADILGNQTLVRMFSRRKYEFAVIHKDRLMIEKVHEKNYIIVQKWATIRQITLYIFQIATALSCVYLYSGGLISIAALIFTITYLGRISGSLYAISGVIRTVEQTLLDAARITDLIVKTPDVQDEPDAANLHVDTATIHLDNVSYRYPDSKNLAVFEDLSLNIPHGESVGLVGKSGGGKSTLTHLLLHYMDVQSGKILIDQQDISRVKQDSLRETISFVPQDPFLFHRSLRENISYGQPEAKEHEVIAAAKKAYAWDFIEKLPNGLDTIVGERGVKLSGGQRQRVAIARAILKDAPILILDEATSALDSESEQYIQKALGELMKNRTSIVIAHRLSTIAKLDRIIVLDEGKIVEDGKHAELLKNDGTYAKLWRHQSGGFIDE